MEPTKPPHPLDLEVKDAALIFDSVWRDLENELGREKLNFPKEIFFLIGAPGSGKGTQTELILKTKEISAPPIVVSGLLTSPDARRLINAGHMATDREVIYLTLRKLLEPQYQMGALLDGFPRTAVQVEIVKMFYERMRTLRAQMHGQKDYETRFPKPHFRFIVLYIDEAESIQRQLTRGKLAQQHNQRVEESGVGQKLEIRPTDLDEKLARKRYQIFKENTFEALKPLRSVFDCHFIDAHGTIEEVRTRIEEELVYQSSLELDPATFDVVSQIPVAKNILAHARQELVQRLENYVRHQKPLFIQVIELIKQSILPPLERQALTGLVIVPVTSELLTNADAQAMLVDLFSERGYRAIVYDWSRHIPENVDLKTGKITTRKEPTFRVEIRFQHHGLRG